MSTHIITPIYTLLAAGWCGDQQGAVVVQVCSSFSERMVAQPVIDTAHIRAEGFIFICGAEAGLCSNECLEQCLLNLHN